LLLNELESEINLDLTGMLEKLEQESEKTGAENLSEIFQVIVNCRDEAHQSMFQPIAGGRIYPVRF